MASVAWKPAANWAAISSPISDEAENEFVYNTFGKRQLVWLGLSDHETEGEWKWITGESVDGTFSNWARNQPNDGGKTPHDDYAIMGNVTLKFPKVTKKFYNRWYDYLDSGIAPRKSAGKPKRECPL